MAAASVTRTASSAKARSSGLIWTGGGSGSCSPGDLTSRLLQGRSRQLPWESCRAGRAPCPRRRWPSRRAPPRLARLSWVIMTIATGSPGRAAALDHAFDGNTGFRQMAGDFGQHAGHIQHLEAQIPGRQRSARRRPAPAWRQAGGRTAEHRAERRRARCRRCRRPRRRRWAPRPRRGPRRRSEPASPASTTTPLAAPSTLASGVRARTMAGWTAGRCPSPTSAAPRPAA